MARPREHASSGGSDLPTPLLDRPQVDPQEVHLSFNTIYRCRLLVVLGTLEAAAAVVLAAGAYRWSLGLAPGVRAGPRRPLVAAARAREPVRSKV